jgi:glycosyltransferase involved in cell wall biosynthesis
MNICVVIPHYDHFEQFERFLPDLIEHGLPLIVVDDSSPQTMFEALAELLDERAPDSTLIRHETNIGKGGAVMTGLRAALDAGYSHALQIDADGQHSVTAVGELCELGAANPGSMISGQPVFGEDISALRYFSRFISLSFCRFETLSTEIRDAMCGFRLYPLTSIVEIIDNNSLGRRMAFDAEILVRAVWADIPLHYVPVKVRYPDDGKSHFNYLSDNIEISWMHTRLLLELIVRLPTLIRRRLTRRDGGHNS